MAYHTGSKEVKSSLKHAAVRKLSILFSQAFNWKSEQYCPVCFPFMSNEPEKLCISKHVCLLEWLNVFRNNESNSRLVFVAYRKLYSGIKTSKIAFIDAV